MSGNSNKLGFFKQCNSEVLVSRGFQSLQGSEGSGFMRYELQRYCRFFTSDAEISKLRKVEGLLFLEADKARAVEVQVPAAELAAEGIEVCTNFAWALANWCIKKLTGGGSRFTNLVGGFNTGVCIPSSNLGLYANCRLFSWAFSLNTENRLQSYKYSHF